MPGGPNAAPPTRETPRGHRANSSPPLAPPPATAHSPDAPLPYAPHSLTRPRPSFALAAAGVGTIGLVDADTVDASNLQRQVLHTTDRIGQPKTASARIALEALNPDVDVVEHRVRMSSENVDEILEGYDLVVDGTDNFPTRYLLNDASLKHRIPVVHASILRFEGQLSVV